MSAWVECICGNRICTGAFPNPGGHRVISEESYDAVGDPVDRTKLGVLFLQGRELIECPRCGRILLRGEGGTYRSYTPERLDAEAE